MTQDLPVVVAVRLSLSFPLLLAAVPLWAKDFTYSDPVRKAQTGMLLVFRRGPQQ